MYIRVQKAEQEVASLDNIIFERVYDNSFFIVKVTVNSKNIRATIDELFMDNSRLLELSTALTSLPFPMQEDNTFYWEYSSHRIAEKELSFRITQMNKLGHMLVEVKMLIEDESMGEKHQCCFFIKTEIGLLNAFGKRLISLNELPHGIKIALVDSE